MQRFNAFELVWMTAPALLLLVAIGIHTKYRADTLSRDAKQLAGKGAIRCASSACEVAAFKRKQPFWTRAEREVTYCGFSGGGSEKFSESRVFTPRGELFRIVRRPASGLMPTRTKQTRLANPRLIIASAPIDETPYQVLVAD